MRAFARLYRSHRSGRLIFVVITLSLALAGAYANFSLSHKAITAFNGILAFGDQTRILVSGRYAEAVTITKGRVDAPALAQDLMDTLRQAAPPEATVASVSTFQSRLDTDIRSQPVTVYAFSGELVETVGATVVHGEMAQLARPDHCALGAELADSLDLGVGDTALLSGIACRIAAVISVPQRPPASSMNAAVIIREEELSYTLAAPETVSVVLNAPAARINAEMFQQRLRVALDLSRLQLWSSEQIQQEAARLKRIVSTISSGLGLIILLVGTGSVVSLMSYSVSERRKEIAIRLTIGASRTDIAMQFVVETCAICFLGLLFGVIAGVALAQYLVAPLNSFMTVGELDQSATDLVPFVQTCAGFIAVTLLASLGPAFQAARTDPATVFRAQ